MEHADPERIRELKLAAKWSSDNYEKKQAVLQLLQCGDEALPAIKEVLAVTVYDDVKQTCIEAISLLGREQKGKQAPDNKTVHPSKKTRKARAKSQKKKARK
ncbi:MAG TPA: hypothetical protein VFS46_06485 [Nitrososphaera sp.]|nr:hypothetical protein [Nitrososphaera sp.]